MVERPVEDNAVIFNFGLSTYVRNAPGLRGEESIIRVPIEGKIPLVPKDKHPIPSLQKQAFTELRGEDLIIVPIDNGFYQQQMAIYWVPERREWVGICSTSWLESDAWGQDSYEEGPYALDDFYTLRILGAFGLLAEKVVPVIENKFSLQEVLQMSPEEISEMVRGINNAYREVSH